MAVFGIRTGWGPQATKDRREYELKKLAAEEQLALEKEATKQLIKGDADVAAALMGIPPASGAPAASYLGLDWSDPTTQVGAGVVALAALFLARRRGWV